MGKILKMRSTFSRPADATAYTAGDEISSSATAGSVVRAVFNLSGYTRGRIVAAAIDVTPASGNFVVTASDMEMQLYKTVDAPAAVGDNVTMPIGAAVQALSLGTWRFDDGAWLNQLGALTAGTSAFQEVPANMAVPTATPGLQVQHVPGHFFTFEGGLADAPGATSRQLTASLRALGAWTPTAVVNAFGITIDIEVE
ncbi:MAG: hypothetical protein ACREA9_01235 [Pyrinomonadaceae bacterium]